MWAGLGTTADPCSYARKRRSVFVGVWTSEGGGPVVAELSSGSRLWRPYMSRPPRPSCRPVNSPCNQHAPRSYSLPSILPHYGYYKCCPPHRPTACANCSRARPRPHPHPRPRRARPRPQRRGRGESPSSSNRTSTTAHIPPSRICTNEWAQGSNRSSSTRT